MNQRWRDRRDSYRPAGEVIDTARYEVAAIPDDTTAKGFVLQHHYSGAYPSARYRFGLYTEQRLVGVAVYSVPSNDKTLTNVFRGVPAMDATELGRFVLLDSVPGNGETWFLARTFEALRAEGLVGVVSFSDPMPRVSSAGIAVFPGHLGTIYQAHNAVYLGRGTARTLRLLPSGQVLSARALQKIRAGERGQEYAVEQLVRAGAAPLTGDPRAWVRTWVPLVTRPLRHAGNHRYAWTLERRHRKLLAPVGAYPKARD